MVYVPTILNYRPFYIQTDVDDIAVDTREWGMVAKTNPFPVLPVPKEPFKIEWLDEDGDDEYNSQMHYQPIEFEVQFYVKAYVDFSDSEVMPLSLPDTGVTPNPTIYDAKEKLFSQIDTFFSKIKNGEFMIYDSYTGLGRRKVRYAGYKEEDFKQGDNWAKTIFTITFKVNDPITRVALRNGKLVEV